MEFYVFYRSLPEVKDLPREDQDRLLAETRWKVLRHWQVWAIVLGSIAIWVFAVPIADTAGPLLGRVMVMAAFIVPIFLLNHVVLLLRRPYLRHALAELQTAVPVTES